MSKNFGSVQDFLDFCTSVRGEYRYLRTPRSEEFLSILLEQCESREIQLPSGCSFWRAQLGAATIQIENRIDDDDDETSFHYEEDRPFKLERMRPSKLHAREGRINPKGIPFLYLASDQKTAISEVRPWVGASVSIATFRTERPLRVVDFSVRAGYRPNIDAHFGQGTVEEINTETLHWIDREFSRPVGGDDSSNPSYIPTQIIAEALRKSGLDGVIYKSRLGPGNNLALFDVDAALPTRCLLFEVTGVDYTFRQEWPPA